MVDLAEWNNSFHRRRQPATTGSQISTKFLSQNCFFALKGIWKTSLHFSPKVQLKLRPCIKQPNCKDDETKKPPQLETLKQKFSEHLTFLYKTEQKKFQFYGFVCHTCTRRLFVYVILRRLCLQKSRHCPETSTTFHDDFVLNFLDVAPKDYLM